MADTLRHADATTYPFRTSEAFDEADYCEWVREELGSPTVKVELTDKQITNAFRKALVFYSKKKPRHLFEAWVAAEGISVHVFKTLGMRAVYDIQFQGVVEGLQAPNIEAQLLSGSFAYYGVAAPKFDLRYYEYARQWVKIASRELSSEPAFKISPDRKSVFIYAPGREMRVTAEVAVDHVDPTTIPAWGQDWMQEYVLARCKINLGRVRGKHRSIPAANGSLELDGETLLTEGREEKKELEEQLERARAHLAPSWG